MSMMDGKGKQALGVGLGIGVVGAVALALRYGLRQRLRPVLSESLSPAIFATRVVPTSLGQMVYHISGSGSPLVFLHGIYPGASSYEWSRVYAKFTNEWEVLAPDLIGFGESERPATALDLADQARSLVEFLHQTIGDRRPMIVASGVGAKLALYLAAQHPELPERLVLWQPLGIRQALRGRVARAALGINRLPWLRTLAWRSYLSSPEFLRSWVKQVGFEDPEAEDEETVGVLSACAGLYQAEAAIWAYFQGSFGEDLSRRLADIVCPVDIFWPENSPNYPVSRGEALAGEIPGSRFETVALSGLLAPLRSPTAFHQLIQSALHPPGEEFFPPA